MEPVTNGGQGQWNGTSELMDDRLREILELLIETDVATSVNVFALVLLLIDKGIVAPDELDKYKNQSTAICDQQLAHLREELRK